MKNENRNTLNNAESVVGFAAWLTTRKQGVKLGANHGASIAADLAREFCESNNLDAVRDGWTDNLTHPNQD